MVRRMRYHTKVPLFCAYLSKNCPGTVFRTNTGLFTLSLHLSHDISGEDLLGLGNERLLHRFIQGNHLSQVRYILKVSPPKSMVLMNYALTDQMFNLLMDFSQPGTPSALHTAVDMYIRGQYLSLCTLIRLLRHPYDTRILCAALAFTNKHYSMYYLNNVRNLIENAIQSAIQRTIDKE